MSYQQDVPVGCRWMSSRGRASCSCREHAGSASHSALVGVEITGAGRCAGYSRNPPMPGRGSSVSRRERASRGAMLGANMHRSQAAAGDTGRLSSQVRSPPGDRGRQRATGRACMACKRSGVSNPRSSTSQVKAVDSSACLLSRSSPSNKDAILNSNALIGDPQLRALIRAIPMLPQNACISCKRAPIAIAIGAGQSQFSRHNLAREPEWEPSGFARTEHRFRKRTGGDADRCPGFARSRTVRPTRRARRRP